MRFLIAILALAGLVDSVLALRIHQQDPTTAPPCAITERWDCGRVNHSRYAVFPPESLFEEPGSKAVHIPVAWFGIVGYGLIAGLALARQLWAVLAFSIVGFGFAGYLSYLEARIIEKWCIYCVWSQALMTGIVICCVIGLVTQQRRARRLPGAATLARG